MTPAPFPVFRRRLGLLGAAGLLVACHRAPPAAPMTMPPVPVTVETVVARDLPLPFDYLGRTAGSREVEIRARVSGYLQSRDYDEGAIVAAGTALFTIDRRPFEATVAAARADAATADAELQQADREAARLEPLLADDAVTQKERDDAVSAAQIARARHTAAMARLQQAELDLSYCDVTAPIAGKTGRALRAEGSLIAPGQDDLLTTLLRLDPIYVDFHRTENQQFAFDADVQSGRLRLPDGGALAVELRHRDGTLLASGGRIDFTAGRLDVTTGTIPMRAELPNPELRLRAGQAVRVVLRGAVLQQAIAVPQRVVADSPQGKVVMVVTDSPDGGLIAEQRHVEVGEWIDLPGEGPVARGWIVRAGLAVGDRVIVDNLVKLRPGSGVQIAPATAPPTAGTDSGPPSAAPATAPPIDPAISTEDPARDR